jgi:hypothetical protein
MLWWTGRSISFVESATIPIHPLVGCRSTDAEHRGYDHPAIPWKHKASLLPAPSHCCGLSPTSASACFVGKAPAVGVGSAR